MSGIFLLTLTGCDAESLLKMEDGSEQQTALKILGTDSRVLGYVDVGHELNLIEDFVGGLDSITEGVEATFENFIERTGINVRKDIRGVYVGVNGFEDHGAGAVLAFVDFDQDALVNRIMQEAGADQVDTSWPVDIFTFEGEETGAVAFVEGSLVIAASSEEHLDLLLDRAFSDEKSGTQRDQLLDVVSNHSSWLVVRDVAEAVESELSGNSVDGSVAMILPVIRSIEHFAVATDMDDESVELHFYLAPIETVESSDLRNVIGGVKSMARLQMRNNEEISDLIEKIEIDSDGDLVEISFEYDHEELKQLEQSLKESFGSMIEERGEHRR